MGIREDMENMMNGDFTEKVMDNEEKAKQEESRSGSKNQGNSSQSSNNEIDNQSNDNSQAATATETGGETTGVDDGEKVVKSIEDTTVTAQEGTKEETKVNEVAQTQETKAVQESADTGNAQPDGKDDELEKLKTDESTATTEEVNYKQKYEELQKSYESTKAFQDTVTADFKANGKMVKGISDADKIVKNLQMSTGLTSKVAEYKKIKPFVEPMQKRGLMQNPDKFDMHMKMEDGDIGAIKQFLKDKEIDPIDLDFDDKYSYSVDNTRASNEEMMFTDMQETAESYGVSDKFTNTVLSEWDAESTGRLFEGNNGRVIAGQLAEQMANGIYDKVSAISENMKITQPGFNAMSSIDQYNKASEVYNLQARTVVPEQKYENEPVAVKSVVAKETTVEPTAMESQSDMEARIRAEIASEVKANEEKRYREKLESENNAAIIARNNANSFSQDHSVSNTTQSTEPKTLAERRAEFERMKRM